MTFTKLFAKDWYDPQNGTYECDLYDSQGYCVGRAAQYEDGGLYWIGMWAERYGNEKIQALVVRES